MDKNNWSRKSMVFGIIVLLFGANVIPSIGGNTGRNTNVEIEQGQSNKLLEQFPSPAMFFTENKGQFPDQVFFQTHVNGATLYFCQDEIFSVFVREIAENTNTEQRIDRDKIRDHLQVDSEPQQREMISVVTTFVGANPHSVITGEGVLPNYNNYFIGNNPDKWYTKVPNYQSVVYHDIYPGIDLRYYSQNHMLKYDFIVRSGADPSQITVAYDGVEQFQMTSDGQLEMRTRFGTILEQAPVIYQEYNGERQVVHGRYVLGRQSQSFGFALVEPYDHSRLLVIDPALIYSTYLGGTNNEMSKCIAVDQSGCAYITGSTVSSNFPTVNSYDSSYNGNKDVFVSKLSAQGNQLLYSTYLGGTYDDGGSGIAVDQSGCAYITGYTISSNFPTVNPYDPTYNGHLYDAFISKLSAQGNQLLYSTYLGGKWDDGAMGGGSIAVDQSGCAYITGWTNSTDFPTVNAYDPTLNDGYYYLYDAFVSKLSAQGNQLLYSTYLGGADDDQGKSIAIDQSGCAYITGWTICSDFPTVNAYDPTYNGFYDAFISKLSAQGNELLYSTYLGGTYEEDCSSIAVDQSGCAYIIGETYSSDFPTVNAYDPTLSGNTDAFISKLSAQGNQLLYSTYLGGSNADCGNGIAVDQSGYIYITGWTFSFDFPTVNAYDSTCNGDIDIFISKLSTQDNQLLYSTYFGGTNGDDSRSIAVDQSGYAYITGATCSSNFPTVNAYDSTYNGNIDVIISKFSTIIQSQPPYIPIHAEPLHVYDHPNDMNKGIGKIKMNQPGGVIQQFTTTSSNTETNIYYKFYFGDNTNSGWLGPYTSGQVATTTHDYNAIGTFNVTATCKIGVDGTESNSSDPQTVMMYLNGDTSGNNILDFDDINPFVLMLTCGKNPYYAEFPNGYFYTGDINEDGQVDFGDINPFVALLCEG